MIDKYFEKRFRVGTCYMGLIEIIEKGHGDLTKDIIDLFDMLNLYDNEIRNIEVEESIYESAVVGRKYYLNHQMNKEANNCRMIKEYISKLVGRV